MPAVFSACLLMHSLSVSAQAEATTIPGDVDRIRALAEQAAPEQAVKAQAVVAEQAGGEQVDAEEQAPLPPNETLPLGQSGGGLFNASGGEASSGSGLGDGWLLSTLAALGVVLAMVFGIRWMLRRGGIATASAPQGSLVEVLSRTTIAPRSHVMLMRVGQRILIVSDSSAGMRTLSTIHEPEEVAELLGAVDASRPTSMTQSFGGVMKKLSGQWQEEPAAVGGTEEVQSLQDAVEMDQARGAVSDVRGRLAALAGAGGRS